MMENLTFAHKIIKPHTVDPLEGHTVVIFEKIGEAGEEFRFEIEPGMRMPRSRIDLFKWLRGRGGTNYFAYAVTNDPELRLRFATPVKMDVQAHTFMLVTSLAYAVSDPRLLVMRRNDDPLRKLREEIGARLQYEFASKSWISIRHEFRELSADVIASTSALLGQFAARYGLTISDLALTCELDEKDFADARHEAAIEQQIDIHEREANYDRLKITEESKTTNLRSEHQHEERLRQTYRDNEIQTLQQMQALKGADLQIAVDRLTNNRRIAAAVATAAEGAIGTAGGAIRTPAELLQAFTTLQTAVGQMRAVSDGTLPAVSEAIPLLAASAQNGVAAVLAEMFVQTAQMPWPIQRKQELQSAILHLVGELLLDGAAATVVVEQHRSRVEALRSGGGLRVEQFDYLKKFTDADRLRNEIQ